MPRMFGDIRRFPLDSGTPGDECLNAPVLKQAAGLEPRDLRRQGEADEGVAKRVLALPGWLLSEHYPIGHRDDQACARSQTTITDSAVQ